MYKDKSNSEDALLEMSPSFTKFNRLGKVHSCSSYLNNPTPGIHSGVNTYFFIFYFTESFKMRKEEDISIVKLHNLLGV